MKKILLSFSLFLFSLGALAQVQTPERIITFRFVPGQDMFYIPWEGNGEQLNTLYALVEQYRGEITSGAMPVYVDGYSASMKSAKENIRLAFVRANRVKSELITHKGLVEDNFITKNYTTAYTDTEGQIHKDMVVVTLRIPAKPAPEPEVKVVEREEIAVVEEEPVRVVQPQPAPVILPAKETAPYCFAVRTNLLYDAFLLPTLGVEWRINRHIGIKVDGSRSWWGDAHGKVQKVWLVNPEIRWYLLNQKKFYVGAAANFGQYNVYKGMIGGLFSDETGYQGKLWNAGASVGYQLSLSRSFSLDFNLGLGYNHSAYDSFTMIDGVRVYKDQNKTKIFWGPTQAGINLIWKIGNKK